MSERIESEYIAVMCMIIIMNTLKLVHIIIIVPIAVICLFIYWAGSLQNMHHRVTVIHMVIIMNALIVIRIITIYAIIIMYVISVIHQVIIMNVLIASCVCERLI